MLRRKSRRTPVDFTTPQPVHTVTFLTAHVPKNQSPERHLASARSLAGLRDCCWKELIGGVAPVMQPLKIRCVALHVGRSWKRSVNYEQAYAAMQTKQFGSLSSCPRQMLLASRIVYTDADNAQLWDKRVVLMMDPVICATCGSRMGGSLRHDGKALAPAVCVSKMSPILPDCVHALGVLPPSRPPVFAPA